MNVTNRISYYLLLLLFPISFVLHAVNENFGLIALGVIGKLFLIYIGIALAVAALSNLIFRQYTRAFFFSFVILLVYFLFGVFKDFLVSHSFLRLFSRYKVLLPAIMISIIAFAFLLKRTSNRFERLSRVISTFLLINFIAEGCWSLYNIASKADQKQDFGDYHHTLIKEYKPSPSITTPSVFWLVFDEYAASSTLKNVWHFVNPLDSILRNKGFFVPDSTKSNYNFTHYSITSTLDMVYLNGLSNHSIVTLRDLARGTYAIYDNNVVRVFEKTGYQVKNYTIFQLQDHPTKGILKFEEIPESLVTFRTMGGRVQHDIGWNFVNMFKPIPQKEDSLDAARGLHALGQAYDGLLQRSFTEIRRGAGEQKPSFFMFHIMLPHEPFMYRADGSIAYQNGFSDLPENYIGHLQYTNTVVNRLIDTILSSYRQKDLVIILQGDHGFKFQEKDTLYDKESCRIFYAAYCSDKDYSGWYNTMSTVNTFRVLFNKYFKTNFPILPDTSYNLYYRVE